MPSLNGKPKQKEPPYVLLEDKLAQLTSGLPSSVSQSWSCNIPSFNASTIAEYIGSIKMEINLSDHYKRI